MAIKRATDIPPVQGCPGGPGEQAAAELQAWHTDNTPAGLVRHNSFVRSISMTIPKVGDTPQALAKKSEKLWAVRRDTSFGLSPNALWLITEKAYSVLGERQVGVQEPGCKDETPVKISEDTLESLHYVGGYFIRSLSKTQDPNTKDFLMTLTTTKTDSTRHAAWTKLQNRGGLVFITDNFYDVLHRMEIVSSGILKKGLHARKIADIVSSAINSDAEVGKLWDHATRSLSIKQGTNIFETLVRRFSYLRCVTFASKLDAQYRAAKKQTGSKRSAGLRAVLREKAQH